MSGKKQWALFLYVLVLLAAIGLLPQLSEAKTHLKLATATKGGTYYPVGVAIATLINEKLSSAKGISMEAVTSAGSFENIDLLEDNNVGHRGRVLAFDKSVGAAVILLTTKPHD